MAQTARTVDLGHLLALDGPTGTAITFITPDGDRCFGVAPGIAGDYPASAVPCEIVRKAAVNRSVSNLQKALMTIRNTLEGNQ